MSINAPVTLRSQLTAPYTFAQLDANFSSLSQGISTAGSQIDQAALNGVTVVSSISALRGLLHAVNSRAFVLGYYAAGDGGGGAYYYDPTDTTSADNGGTIIVASDGGRWKLVYQNGLINILQFGAKADGVTDATSAINSALQAAQFVFVPEGVFLHTGITLAYRGSMLFGAGIRSVLKHTGSGAAITCSDSSSTVFGTTRAAYVNDGQFRLENLCLYTNGPIGINMAANRTTGSTLSRLYMMPAVYYNALTSSTYVAGTVAIACDNKPWNGTESTYGISVKDCQIAGYESMGFLNEVVNLWEFDNVYTVDCLNYLKLATNPGANPGVGKIRIANGYCESGIAAARGIVFGSGGGTAIAITNMTYELTNAAGTQYAYDFSAGGTWTQIRAINCTYLITNDGSGVNNRRIIGTAPTDFTEEGRNYVSSVYSAVSMDWAPGSSGAAPMQVKNNARFGGFQQGSGRIAFGRSDTDTADSVIRQDIIGNLTLQAYSNLQLMASNPVVTVTFSSAPTAGATSGTLSANWARPSGTYNTVFSDGEIRDVTYTNGATSATWSVGLTTTITTTAYAADVPAANGNGWEVNIGGQWFGPMVDNSVSLGAPGNRPTVIYAVSGTISTSDRREKQDIRSLDDKELAVCKRLRSLIKTYRWKDAVAKKAEKGEEARIHIGWIAQDVMEAFKAEGLDPFKYGCICHDKWEAREAVIDPQTGAVIEEAREAGDRYSIRIDQIQTFVLAVL